MPLALVILAYLAVVTGLTGRWSTVGAQFETDVMGSNGQGGFLQFLVGIIGIAIFFRVVDMPNAGRVFMGLVIIVFLLQNANVLTTLENIVGTSTTATTSPGATAASGAVAQAPAANAAPSSPTTTPSGGGT